MLHVWIIGSAEAKVSERPRTAISVAIAGFVRAGVSDNGTILARFVDLDLLLG
jgi:hypothetical protein